MRSSARQADAVYTQPASLEEARSAVQRVRAAATLQAALFQRAVPACWPMCACIICSFQTVCVCVFSPASALLAPPPSPLLQAAQLEQQLAAALTDKEQMQVAVAGWEARFAELESELAAVRSSAQQDLADEVARVSDRLEEARSSAAEVRRSSIIRRAFAGRWCALIPTAFAASPLSVVGRLHSCVSCVLLEVWLACFLWHPAADRLFIPSMFPRCRLLTLRRSCVWPLMSGTACRPGPSP